jgi:hypothetical protein
MNTDPADESPVKRKLQPHELVVASLPLVLLAIGGAVGGAIGGIAVVLNMAIFRKDISPGMKYLFSVLITLAAGIAYIGVILLLVHLFPNVFGRK